MDRDGRRRWRRSDTKLGRGIETGAEKDRNRKVGASLPTPWEKGLVGRFRCLPTLGAGRKGWEGYFRGLSRDSRDFNKGSLEVKFFLGFYFLSRSLSKDFAGVFF
jgi:hypothetical protein